MVDNFIKESPALGEYTKFKHRIKLKADEIVSMRPYTVPFRLIPTLKEEINRLLDQKITSPSNSSFASPAFIIPKKNGKLRMVIDYRKLNSITEKESYPLPRIRDILSELHGSKFFTQIDLNSGYHQISVAEESREKTAFVLPFGHHEFNRLPFGATNAPRTFQMAMNRVFSNLSFVKVYLDDILVHSDTLENHYDHVRETLKKD